MRWIQSKTPIKYARTVKDYPAGSRGYSFTIPAGSRVCNNTACGPDDNYHYWLDFHKQAESLTGFKNSILHHDLTYYGLEIPAEYCGPYPKMEG